MTNAFASIYHQVLDQVCHQCANDEDANLLQLRHRRAMILIGNGTDTEVLLQPSVGDLQGDVTAPTKFVHAFSPAIETWQTETRSMRD
ncbi:unnamed protein product, partial [Polarella glacialis]